MQINFRNLVLASAGMAAFATSAAMAETLKVPFSFVAAGRTCPAGTYSVNRDANATLVTLKSLETSKTFLWTVGPGDPDPADKRIVMNFDQVGDAHVLRSIQYAHSITARLDKKIQPNERNPGRITQGQ